LNVRLADTLIDAHLREGRRRPCPCSRSRSALNDPGHVAPAKGAAGPSRIFVFPASKTQVGPVARLLAGELTIAVDWLPFVFAVFAIASNMYIYIFCRESNMYSL
jgi:hypothetical protein